MLLSNQNSSPSAAGPPRPPFPRSRYRIPRAMPRPGRHWGVFSNTAGWKLGGCPVFDTTLGSVGNLSVCAFAGQTEAGIPSGDFDFYRMQFSDNQNLTFLEQGQELDSAISAVLAATNKGKVILVAHSMAGLAARSYLQNIRFRNHRVSQLITVGTPHQGTALAAACAEGDPALLAVWLFFLNGSCESLGLEELRPDSGALGLLNDLTHHPLPSDIDYVSIIGTGRPFRIGWVGWRGQRRNRPRDIAEPRERSCGCCEPSPHSRPFDNRGQAVP